MATQYDFDSDVLFTTKDFESDGLVYIGGGKSSKKGFGGCIAWVYLNSRQLDLYNPNQAPIEGLQQCRNQQPQAEFFEFLKAQYNEQK